MTSDWGTPNTTTHDMYPPLVDTLEKKKLLTEDGRHVRTLFEIHGTPNPGRCQFRVTYSDWYMAMKYTPSASVLKVYSPEDFKND